MDWGTVISKCIFGVTFLCVSVAILFVSAKKQSISQDVARIGYVFLSFALFFWCVFAVISAYFHISFYYVLLFVPLMEFLFYLSYLVIFSLRKTR